MHSLSKRAIKFILLVMGISTLIFIGNRCIAGDYSHQVSFQERVQCKKIIEKIYYEHRTWPEANHGNKPSFESVMTEHALQAEVENSLKKSNALAIYWQHPITGEQLQAEMNRIAKSSKQPEILKELWANLNNDPHLIAECLIRPLLANQLLHIYYASDTRFHGQIRAHAESALRQYSKIQDMKLMGGHYFETEWTNNKKLTDLKPGNFKFNEFSGEPTWMQHLHVGKVSELQEDEEGFYIIAILAKDKTKIKVAIVEWSKIPLDEWWMSTKEKISTELKEPDFNYLLPEIAENNCEPDTWIPTYANPSLRHLHTAIWTGSEMIVWGGWAKDFTNTGLRYNPVTDAWVPMNVLGAPEGRVAHTAIWTGTEMLIWGGHSCAGDPCNDIKELASGGRYNPATDNWRAISTTNAPTKRLGNTAVWTGSRMIIWGGDGCLDQACTSWGFLKTGALYDPTNDRWASTSTAGAPDARKWHTAVWTGSRMIIWGGEIYPYDHNLSAGGLYNPNNNSWKATNLINAPLHREYHTALWTGNEMIIWGGYCFTGQCQFQVYNSGARYNPSTNTWIPTSTINAPQARMEHTAIWAGNRMIIWGGQGGDTYYTFLNNGSSYNPSTNTWIEISSSNAPSGRIDHTAVWTGNEMIVWGGHPETLIGGRYSPSSDTWTYTSIAGLGNYSPFPRCGHSAIWTGTEMIIWGGGYFITNTGDRYDLILDAWTPISILNAPEPRSGHDAVWTGNEMIVWGGEGFNDVPCPPNNFLITGGKYNPTTNQWSPTSTINAPESRFVEAVVWTGNEMIVWGGFKYNSSCSGTIFINTGGKYNPATDNWTATDASTAPFARAFHTAIWSGAEMIVWGGQGCIDSVCSTKDFLNTGGRYNPTADTWTSTTLSSAPQARSSPDAIWTGNEMIIWAGWCDNVNCPLYYALNTGGRYNPQTNTWVATDISTAPTGREGPIALWTGNDMIIWGGWGCIDALCSNGKGDLISGALYNPVLNAWTPISSINAPSPREATTAAWTGSQMIIWGGYSHIYLESGYNGTGAIYCTGINFSMSVNPEELNISPGNQATATVTIISSGGFNRPVNLACENLPPNVTCDFNPNPVTFPGGNTTATSTLTVTVNINQSPGSYIINVTGSTSELLHKIPLKLNILNASSLKANPLHIDLHSDSQTNSNVNGLLEPGEIVMVEPKWVNLSAASLALSGTASNWTGPSGATYAIINNSADYGTVTINSASDCYNATGICYLLGVSQPAPRPILHWDATFDETLNTGDSKIWTVHIGNSFSDVSLTNPFYSLIETILHARITNGCTASAYCPASYIQRQQMAKFLCRALELASPGFCDNSTCKSTFDDVPSINAFCPHIESIFSAGIAAGCNSYPLQFCPTDYVQRQAMAKFLCKAMNFADPGSCSITSCTGIFSDVPSTNPFCGYIEGLFNAQVTSGCSTSLYCPSNNVQRNQMAKFLVNAFGFTL